MSLDKDDIDQRVGGGESEPSRVPKYGAQRRAFAMRCLMRLFPEGEQVRGQRGASSDGAWLLKSSSGATCLDAT